MEKKTESQLLKEIITALYDKYKDDALVIRLNSGAFKQGKRWIRSTSITGMPDIIVILRGGQYIGLEVKTDKGKLNENQLKFQSTCLEKQIPYFVVRSVEEALQAIDLNT